MRLVVGKSIVLVAGGGGFIGGHLATALVRAGHRVRMVDNKPLDAWYQTPAGAEIIRADLSNPEACREAVRDVEVVYNLAADMGGMGFIETHKAACMLSVLINTNLLLAARDAGTARYLFSSSACVYAASKQTMAEIVPLAEIDAYPAMPEDGYGWEKLFSERMCRHFTEDYGLQTRVARYHNVYGPNCTFAGGREKAPAAICRKVIEAVQSGDHSIEVWGDGKQTRSFMFVDDCVTGTLMLAGSEHADPINVGSSELVTIDQLVDMAADIAGIKLRRIYDYDAPKGVRGRNSDNTMIKSILGWEPTIPLRRGLEATYAWIYGEMGGSSRTIMIPPKQTLLTASQ